MLAAVCYDCFLALFCHSESVKSSMLQRMMPVRHEFAWSAGRTVARMGTNFLTIESSTAKLMNVTECDALHCNQQQEAAWTYFGISTSTRDHLSANIVFVPCKLLVFCSAATCSTNTAISWSRRLDRRTEETYSGSSLLVSSLSVHPHPRVVECLVHRAFLLLSAALVHAGKTSLDLADRLGRVQSLRTRARAVHDRVALVQLERVVQRA